MALSKNFTFTAPARIEVEGSVYRDDNHQVNVDNAYIKVASVNGSKISLTAKVLISNDQLEISRIYTFKPSTEDGSDNFVRQAYLYLKTLPEFAGAIDV